MEGDPLIKTLTKGYLYIVAHPNIREHCKIGITTNLRRRLHGYQTGCPHREFYYVHWWEVVDVHSAERVAFDVLRGTRVKNTEWFRVHPLDALALIGTRVRFLTSHGIGGPGGDGETPSGQVRHPLPSGDE